MNYVRSFFAVAAITVTVAAQADDCTFEIEVGDAMQYSTSVMGAKTTCETVKVVLKHTGKLPAQAMGHNWVLSRPDDFQGLTTDGMSAGFENNYLPQDDKRVIAFTKLIGGGESASIEFSVKDMKAGDYTFFCSFPGHWSVMKGVFTLS